MLAGMARAGFRITVVDEENGWPVPLVELRTVDHQRFVSDNAGVIAITNPDLMNREVWFLVKGHGYEVSQDGFGYRGVRLKPSPGGKSLIRVKRRWPGKRLGRLTGAGLLAESQKLGDFPEWKESGVVGCDSVLMGRHNKKLVWAWGDTMVAKYPLGLFHATSATTSLRPVQEWKPPILLHFDYLRDDKGGVRNVAQMPGEGPTWLGGLVSLPAQGGNRKLVATYVKIRNHLTVYEAGLCVWNAGLGQFQQHKVLWNEGKNGGKAPVMPSGHPIQIEEKGRLYHLFGNPFPEVKIEATFEAWEDPTKWQHLKPQGEVLTREGSKIKVHRGSIAWNEYLKKWVAIFTRMKGEKSLLGEIWFAWSDSPFGIWEDARLIVEHDNYTFYNPRIHPELVGEKSSFLLFEGTYTSEFANRPEPTPRYNYNQVLYRLDLDDEMFRPDPE